MTNAGCASRDDASGIVMETLTPTHPVPTRDKLPGSAITSTATQVPTLTSTATETPIPTHTPTRTPNPTLPPEEAEQLAVELLTTNAGCRLPCWWGFTPGQTTWAEAEIFLEQFDSDIYIPYSLEEQETFFFASVTIPLPDIPGENWNTYVNHTYFVEKGIIDAIDARTGIIETQKLSTFLQIYGPPEEIWIVTKSTGYPEGYLSFLIILFYPEQGILAFRGPLQASFTDNGMVRGCQFDNPHTNYYLWAPNSQLTLMDVFRKFGKDYNTVILPIEEATGMSVIEFYEIFKQSGADQCLETPRELWPPQ